MAGFINFEDEEEVRSYLENLHVEYSYQCFKEKDPDGKRPHQGLCGGGAGAARQLRGARAQRELLQAGGLPGHRQRWAGQFESCLQLFYEVM
uniref:Uncharacterized protein n=1 Tax=Strix occidentalis caurina TaxID=311401 RepID=A0A8D0FAL1_STROC